MKLSYIVAAIEEFAPRVFQEPWDNSGLQVSLPQEAGGECTGVLLCLDVTEDIITEAVERNCNLVLSHHPLIFKGLKTLTGRTPAERAVAAAIRAGVAVYSAHTSLDSTRGGVSYVMAQLLGAKVRRILVPKDMPMERVSVICPRSAAADVRLLMLDGCGDGVENPTSWDVEAAAVDEDRAAAVPTFDIRHTPLTRIELTVPAMNTPALLQRLDSMPIGLKTEVHPLERKVPGFGLGVVAEFDKPVALRDMPALLRQAFGTETIRANVVAGVADGGKVRRIALCGGAGGEFIPQAVAAGADAYVTADIRYHDFADNRSGMALYDVGHFESEKCALTIFYQLLCKKFPNFAVQNSKLDNNPVKYL